jgi:pimeloyl-ACP methyl ester carboxylesterase
MQIDVDGLTWHYESRGEGRPILVLHGWPSDHRNAMLPLEPVFEGRTGWQRIYPDLPGMGRTAGPEWISDQAGLLDATLRFMDAVAPNQRFATVGVSYGGFLALGVLHERPDRLEGLMLWSPMLVHPSKAKVPDHHVFHHDPEVDGMLEEGEEAWLDISVVHTAETLAAFRTTVKPGLMVADRGFLRAGRLQEMTFPFDQLALPAPFGGPSLLLTGRQDSAVGYADLVSLHESFPRATLAVIDRAGHGVAEEQRSLFRALVGDWLDRMESEPP